MWEYKYKASFGHEEKTVSISEVSGTGGMMFHVMVDNYYVGGIFRVPDGSFRWHSPSNSLTAEDGATLIEIIEKNYKP